MANVNKTIKEYFDLLIKFMVVLFMVVLFMANPVLCALSFALSWNLAFQIVFSLVTFLEIIMLTLSTLERIDS